MIFYFSLNVTSGTVIYTLSLHDALPIWQRRAERCVDVGHVGPCRRCVGTGIRRHGEVADRVRQSADFGAGILRTAGAKDRKSTRLNSSHSQISYAVFCLKKKNETGLGMQLSSLKATDLRADLKTLS